jgi:type IV pilus assembly protein PilM
MALKIVRGRTMPIGVDIGSSSVKLAQLKHADGEMELLAAGVAEVAHRDRDDLSRRLNSLAQGIREVLRSQPFRGRAAVLSLPAEDTVVRHVRVPKLPPKEMARAVEWELQGKLPYAVKEAVVRHVVSGEAFGEGDAKQEVIVVAAARRTLDAYLGMARRAKLDVVGVNVEPCAIVECFGRLFRRSSDAARPILFIDLGAASTQVVLSHGNRIVFARNLAKGGDDLDQAIAQDVGVAVEQAHAIRQGLLNGDMQPQQEEKLYAILAEPMDALADEITKCLRYYESIFRNRSIERAIFIGGQAGDKRLCQSLAKRLDLPAQVGDPLVRVKRPTQGHVGLDQRRPQPRWTVAIGLSIGADRAA